MTKTTRKTVIAVRVALPLNRRFNSNDSLQNFLEEREFSQVASQNKAALGAMGFMIKEDYEAGLFSAYGIDKKHIKSGQSNAIVETAMKVNEELQSKLLDKDAEIERLRAELAGKGRRKSVIKETEVTDETE